MTKEYGLQTLPERPSMESLNAPYEEDEKEFVAMIESIQTTSIVDRDVMAIVQEEATAFFAGQKDLDTVCKNIQDRATKVVQER